MAKVAIIDGDPLVYRVGFGAEEIPEHWARARLKESILGLAFAILGAERAFVAISPSGTHYRHELAVTRPYKGNRKDAKRPSHYDALRDEAINMGARVAQGMEADDLVGHWSSEHTDSVICSIDKDLLMLPGLHYNFVKQEYTEVTPEQGLLTFYRQIVTGDSTDNIQGMGRGAKKTCEIMELGMPEDVLAEIALEGFMRYYEKPEAQLRVIENGHLCWIQPRPDGRWVPPYVLTEE